MSKPYHPGRRLPPEKGGGYLLSFDYLWRLADRYAVEHPETTLPQVR